MAECQRRVSSREFAEWLAYERLEPFGPERDDLRAALVAAVIANVNRDPKKRRKPYEVSDFMPKFDRGPEPERKSDGELLARVEMLNAVFGGVDKRKK